MANALISYPTDNPISLATITVNTGTEDPDYPISEGAKGTEPGKRGKFTGTTGSFVMDFGTAQSIAIWGMPDYYISAGAVVRIQGNATDSWGAPTLSAAITIPAHHPDGFPLGVLKDLTGVAHSFRYWRLVVESGNSVPIQIGQVWPLATKRLLIQNVRFGLRFFDEFPQIQHETDFLWEHIYPYGTNRPGWIGQIKATIGDGAPEQFEEWQYSAGMSGWFFFSVDPEDELGGVYRFNSPRYEREFIYNDDTINFELRAQSRGLRP